MIKRAHFNLVGGFGCMAESQKSAPLTPPQRKEETLPPFCFFFCSGSAVWVTNSEKKPSPKELRVLAESRDLSYGGGGGALPGFFFPFSFSATQRGAGLEVGVL
jgi:hypothetical protein